RKGRSQQVGQFSPAVAHVASGVLTSLLSPNLVLTRRPMARGGTSHCSTYPYPSRHSYASGMSSCSWAEPPRFRLPLVPKKSRKQKRRFLDSTFSTPLVPR